MYKVHLVGYFHSCITMHGFMNVNFSFAFFELQTVQPVANRYTDYVTPVPETEY
jgi:hypothetical protein